MKKLLLVLTLAGSTLANSADTVQRRVQTMDVPRYPPLATVANVAGTVSLSIEVDAEGQVTKATALSGHRMLQESAAENVKSWRFIKSLDGIPSKVTVTYEYQIQGVVYSDQVWSPRIILDLPTKVTIIAPGRIIDTNSAKP